MQGLDASTQQSNSLNIEKTGISREIQDVTTSNASDASPLSEDKKNGHEVAETRVDSEQSKQRVYHTGWRLHTLTAA